MDGFRTVLFRYDYMGRRVQKRVLDASTNPAVEISSRRFLYDGWSVIAEYQAPGGTTIGTLVRSYTWGLDIAVSLADAGGVGALLQIADHGTGKTYMPAYDGNGNVAALVNADSGELAAAYEYSGFGEPLRAQTFDATVADNPFRFSTKWTDVETGLVDYGRRYYDPRNGRFLGRDPIEETGGLNLYGFVGNNPVNRWDYLGMVPRWGRGRVNRVTYRPQLLLGGRGPLRNILAGETDRQSPFTQGAMMDGLQAEIEQEAGQARAANMASLMLVPPPQSDLREGKVEIGEMVEVPDGVTDSTGSVAAPNSATTGGTQQVAVIINGSTFDPTSPHGSGPQSSGNPLGHVAVAVQGQGVFSYGNDTPQGTSLSGYMAGQAVKRDTTIVFIDVSSQQAGAITNFFQQNPNIPVNLWDSNCAVISTTGLAAGGVNLVQYVINPGTNQPIGVPAGHLPSDVQTGAMNYINYTGSGYYITIPKGSTPPGTLKKFDPNGGG